MNFDNKNPLWISVIGSIIGGLVVFLLLRDYLKSQTVPLSYSHQTYNLQNRIWQLENQLYNQNNQKLIQSTANTTNATNTYNTYKNDEKWEIIRDKSGFISNIRVVRDARTT